MPGFRDPDTRARVAEFIELRSLLRLTQREAAAALGVHNRTIGKWERAELPLPILASLAMRHLWALQTGEVLR